MVREKEFREDLFYRLNVLQIYVPSLEERKEDISVLINHYLNLYSKEMGRIVPEFETGAMDVLVEYHWPGNVRQLQNVAQRMLFITKEKITRETVINAIGTKMNFSDQKQTYHFDRDNIVPLKEIERHFRKEYIKFVRSLCKTDAEAAQKLDLAPPNYFRISKELGLK